MRLGVISDADGSRLRSAAARDEKAAGRALRRARELRELIYATFRPIADGAAPPAELLDRLRDADRDALANAHLAQAPELAPAADGRDGPPARGGGAGTRGRAMRWTWPPPRDLTDPLRPITHAAVELLTSGPLEHLKICGNCRWLFLDQSRNHSRRWCSMAECGTQMKQRRFVERRRSRSTRAQ